MNTKLLVLLLLILISSFPLFSQSQIATIPILYPDRDQSEMITIEIKDGFIITEGDIIVGEEKNLHRKAATLTAGSRLWPGGTIPYEIQADHPANTDILEAIQHVNEATNLCLIERTDESDYIIFVNGNSCASSIGKIGGKQTIVASPYCGFGSYIHEILHAAGVYHEQSRHDRDEYITIHEDEINPNFQGNFNKYYSGEDIGEYDYASIMHYHEFAFSSTGEPTISVKMPPATASTVIGQRNGLSSGDIAGIEFLYPEPSSCGTTNLSCEDSGELIDLDGILQWDNMGVTNTGTGKTPTVEVDLFFSKNTVITKNDTYLGSIQVPALVAGQSYKFSQQLDKESIEALANQRQYFLGFIIDAQDEIVESDEFDNNDCSTSSEDMVVNALPVTLIDFSVKKLNNFSVKVEWEVSDEYALAYYQVQYSEDSEDWEERERIMAQNSNEQVYEFIDKSVEKQTSSRQIYYRLKMVDNDGTVKLSAIRTLRIGATENTDVELQVFPNPAKDLLNINIPLDFVNRYEFSMMNGAGVTVFKYFSHEKSFSLAVHHLPAGIYWLKVTTANDYFTKKVIIQ